MSGAVTSNYYNRSKPEKTLEPILGTNDYAAKSKASVIKRGYLNDDHIFAFVDAKSGFRSPLINRGYYLRMKAIEWALDREWISPDYIISLGAGFDTSAFRGGKIKFIEVDLPRVAEQKVQMCLKNLLIKSDQVLSQISDQSTFLKVKSSHYNLISGDLTDIEPIIKIFQENNRFGITKDSKVALLNECCLCYLQEKDSNKSLTLLLQLFGDCSDVAYIGFEQIKNNFDSDGFGGFMERHYISIGHPLRTYPTRTHSERRFKQIGFRHVSVINLINFYLNYLIGIENHSDLEKLEFFDEYEELHLMASNYAVTLATLNSPHSITQCLISTNFDALSDAKPIEDIRIFQPGLRRFSHCSAMINDDEILIFGGFGVDSVSSKHQKLNDFVKVNLSTKALERITIASQIKPRTHATLEKISSHKFMLIGGRSSPKNRFGASLFSQALDDPLILEEMSKLDDFPSIWRHTSNYLASSNKVIIIGGRTFDAPISDGTVRIYDTETSKVSNSTLEPRKLFTRFSHSSCLRDDSCTVLIYGGLNLHDKSFTSSDLITLDLRVPRPIIKRLDAILPLYSHTCHVPAFDTTKMMIIGGISPLGHNNYVNLIDLRMCKVTDRRVIVLENEYPFMINSHTSHLYRNMIEIIGGGGNCFSYGTFFNPGVIQLDGLKPWSF